MNSYDYLEWSVDDGVALVTMDRPPVNAVSQQMYREIAAAFGPESPLSGPGESRRPPGRGPALLCRQRPR